MMHGLRIGVIGVGVFGQRHAQIVSEAEGCSLVAVADKNESVARKVATRYPDCRFYTDYSKLLDLDLDAVTIATPDHLHFDVCMAALERRIPVLVEKPLATTSREAYMLAEASQKSGTILMVNFANRWNPPFASTQRIIESGELGKVLYAEIHLNDSIEVPTQMLSWAQSSSVLWFLCSHTYDLCRWILSSSVAEYDVRFHKGILSERHGIDTPDFYLLSLTFENGTHVWMEHNWTLPTSAPSIVDFRASFVCEKGRVEIDTARHGGYRVYTGSGESYPDILGITDAPDGQRGFAVDSILHFLNCVKTGTKPLVSVEDAVAVTRDIELFHQSARSLS